MKRSIVISIMLLWLAGLSFWPCAAGQSPVTINFTSTNITPLNLGFGGFTCDFMTGGEEYADTNFQQYAAMLTPGWIRFPGGTTSDAFDWTNGMTAPAWTNEF